MSLNFLSIYKFPVCLFFVNISLLYCQVDIRVAPGSHATEAAGTVCLSISVTEHPIFSYHFPLTATTHNNLKLQFSSCHYAGLLPFERARPAFVRPYLLRRCSQTVLIIFALFNIPQGHRADFGFSFISYMVFGLFVNIKLQHILE